MKKKADRNVQNEPAYRLSHLSWVGQMLLILRWLALLLVTVLSLFDYLDEGVLVSPFYVVIGVGTYNLVLLFASRRIRWLRRPLNFLALDTVVATLATYLTGGYHSGFFILYVFNVIGAAFYMDLVPTILVTLVVGLIYVGACTVNQAGLWNPVALYIVVAKLLLLQIVAVLCALLLEQLRREHAETEQERVLTARLSTLNSLLRQLSTSLDLEQTLHTVTDAARQQLAGDVAVLLLRDESDARLSPAAASGIDLRQHAGLRLPLTEEPFRTLLASDEPQVISDTSLYPNLPFREDLRTYAGASLQLNGEPLGLLFVGQRAATQFDEGALSLLQALAQEAALAIRNARLYQRERDQVQQLQRLEQLQRSFISAVSHELRTPLTCIKTSVDLLHDATPAVQAELLETITHHTNRLEALVTDLLESTRLEAGQVTLATQPTDLRRIVERTVMAIAPLMQQKEQHLETVLPNAAVWADVDRRRIEQALTNLLANAHKFTPKGGHVRVTLERRNDELLIAVADDGPGIPREHQVHLFQRFYVIPDGTGKAGLGLGLYIARQLVELHGGHVWVESSSRRGSTFFLALPALKGANG
ncbi:MAG TPA: ATP-binding protein [Anaerolineae bacterium]|nr:ATP-binding protein [Anaerolineae bacterium]HQM13089.1 ATP-binding protein [Anaerolineae bacterium]